jgi:hypothetical protein
VSHVLQISVWEVVKRPCGLCRRNTAEVLLKQFLVIFRFSLRDRDELKIVKVSSQGLKGRLNYYFLFGCRDRDELKLVEASSRASGPCSAPGPRGSVSE